MTRPMSGLILECADAKEFWENKNNPHVTKEQIEYSKRTKEYRKNTNFKELRLWKRC